MGSADPRCGAAQAFPPFSCELSPPAHVATAVAPRSLRCSRPGALPSVHGRRACTSATACVAFAGALSQPRPKAHCRDCCSAPCQPFRRPRPGAPLARMAAALAPTAPPWIALARCRWPGGAPVWFAFAGAVGRAQAHRCYPQVGRTEVGSGRPRGYILVLKLGCRRRERWTLFLASARQKPWTPEAANRRRLYQPQSSRKPVGVKPRVSQVEAKPHRLSL
jgi:hypothetical protein